MSISGLVEVNFDVAFPSAKLASIAARSVAVDEEVRPDRVKRSIVAEENVVKINISGVDVKTVRVSASNVLDSLALCAKTMAVFA